MPQQNKTEQYLETHAAFKTVYYLTTASVYSMNTVHNMLMFCVMKYLDNLLNVQH